MHCLYLCGQITGSSYTEARYGWRLEVAQALEDLANVVCLSPMRGKGHLCQETKISPLGSNHPLSSGHAITTRDRFDVQRSSAIFANLLGMDRVSVGSMIEFGWADAYRVPIIGCVEADGSNPHEHAMASDLISWRCATIGDGIMVARAIFSEDL